MNFQAIFSRRFYAGCGCCQHTASFSFRCARRRLTTGKLQLPTSEMTRSNRRFLRFSDITLSGTKSPHSPPMNITEIYVLGPTGDVSDTDIEELYRAVHLLGKVQEKGWNALHLEIRVLTLLGENKLMNVCMTNYNGGR